MIRPDMCDSALHRIGGYTEFRPPVHLAECVEGLWTYRTPPRESPTHRVLPSSAVSLCFRYQLESRGRPEAPELTLIGPVQRPRLFTPQAGHVTEAIQLKPEWSRALLGVVPGDHVDALDAWRQIDGPRVGRLLDNVMRGVAESGSALPELLRWLEQRLLGMLPDPATRLASGALERLLGRGGARPERIQAVANELGVTARHLRRSVCAAASATPKYLQRVERLNRAVAEADGTPTPRWASLATAHGFYDQAHLIQEFKAFTGRTPVVLHAERRAQEVRFFQSGRDVPD